MSQIPNNYVDCSASVNITAYWLIVMLVRSNPLLFWPLGLVYNQKCSHNHRLHTHCFLHTLGRPVSRSKNMRTMHSVVLLSWACNSHIAQATVLHLANSTGRLQACFD